MELLENPAVDAWKQKQLDKIQSDLANAKDDHDRMMIQARLIELNNLAASLMDAIATGAMAEQQVVDDRKATERRNKIKQRLEVAS